jgi:deoxyuridine 5'-triphosphate nucleotidohydrolase
MLDTVIDEKTAYNLGLSLNDKNEFEELDPNSIDPSLVWHFIRGYFEGNNVTLNSARATFVHFPVLNFNVRKAAYLEKICNFINIPHVYSFDSEQSLGIFQITGTNALDLLGKLYDKANHCDYFIYKNYIDWCRYCVSVFPNESPQDIFGWCKTREDAVAPSKERVSDSGYDLTIVDVVKKFHNKTTLYTTGIKVQPAFGWYLDVVPRSSIIKSGYMLANNVGVIDRGYTGEIMIALIKVDDSAPDLELPCRIAQMIPRRIAHVNLVQYDDIEKTTRNEGGFGSTG